MFKLSDLPSLENKPRDKGISMIMERGISITEARNLVDNRADLIDLIKFPWGSAYVLSQECVVQKVKTYKEAKIEVFIGGTFLEAVFIRDQIDEYLDWLKSLNIDIVEVSDGSIEMDRKEKLNLIKYCRERNLKVISEVGSKDEKKDWVPEKWITLIQEELSAGAWKVIIEGRGNGHAGIYDITGKIRHRVASAIADHIDINQLIWEAPQKEQQDFLINRFGAEVNIGNVQIPDIVALRAMRLGLRGDTLFSFKKQ